MADDDDDGEWERAVSLINFHRHKISSRSRIPCVPTSIQAKFHRHDAPNPANLLFPIVTTTSGRFFHDKNRLFNFSSKPLNSQLKLKHTPTSLFLRTSFRDECGEKKTFNSIIIIRPKRANTHTIAKIPNESCLCWCDRTHLTHTTKPKRLSGHEGKATATVTVCVRGAGPRVSHTHNRK